MPKRIQIVVGASIVVLSLLALYRLLALQYESGDAYPPYSSFRPDPLGTLAFYEALGSLGSTSTERNLTKLAEVDLPPDATLLFFGTQYGDDSVRDIEILERFASEGGRLVILFEPYLRDPFYSFGEDLFDSDSGDEESEGAGDDEDSPGMLEVLAPRMDISERWGFEYGFERLRVIDENSYSEQVDRGWLARGSLPASLPWYSGVYLSDVSKDWTVVYARADRPVAIERPWGDGEIVVVTDSFLVTNEALLSDRSAEYLSWLVGRSGRVVFDESHLGVARRTGLMGLAQRYRVIPVLVSCIFITLLFIWRSASSLVPRGAVGPGEVSEVDTVSTVGGIANLARRSVPVSEILDTCWRLHERPLLRKASRDGSAGSAVERLLARERELPRRRQKPVSTYNRICSELKERKFRP